MEVAGHHGKYLVGAIVALRLDDCIQNGIALWRFPHALLCHELGESLVWSFCLLHAFCLDCPVLLRIIRYKCTAFICLSQIIGDFFDALRMGFAQ